MSQPRILIVEDDDIIATLVEWRLKKLGYEVCGRAAEGNEALSLVQRESPDLVLLDIGLPGRVDGIAVANEIRKLREVPIVFVTGHSEREVIDRAKSTRPDGFILKPFGDDDLRVGIELALR
ncbi:MAG: response regulator [Methanolinea sp.]|jgi:CheY-like chemotaxis protein|nr:response regulator [Methanolinea sp.]